MPDADYQQAPAGWTPPVCTASSSQTPWPDHTQNNGAYDSALYSVGTVPNMPLDITLETYPATLGDSWKAGPLQEITARTWGRQCSDYPQAYCHQQSDCIPGLQCIGMTCAGASSQACTADNQCSSGSCLGVCAPPDICLKHSDCPPDEMCTGNGVCTPPTLVLYNDVTTDSMTFQVYANNTCGPSGDDYSMVGGSYWSYVGQDLLRMHGMCSFGDWFRYTEVTQHCAIDHDAESFTVNPATCQFSDLYQPTAINTTFWWDEMLPAPTVMAMRPTNCDRDYERLQGFSACAPRPGTASYPSARGTANILTPSGATGTLEYDQFARMYSAPGQSNIKIARMPYANNTGM